VSAQPDLVDQGIARPAGVMALATAVSRVTGLFRLLALIFALGVAESRLADTFNIANTLPNILYELILGGVLSSVFIPLVVDGLEGDEGARAVGTLVGTALAALFAFSVACSLAAPLIVRIFTFRAGPEAGSQTALATYFFRFFAFQIFFYGAAAIAGGVLNVAGSFAVPGFAPAANNLVAIVVFAAFAVVERHSRTGAGGVGRLLLGAGTTLAVASMALVQMGPLRRAFGDLPLRVSLVHPLVRRFARLSAWTLLYVAISQIGLAVSLVLANGVTGGPSAFTYANTFYQLPCGVLAVSVMTALMPLLARHATAGDMEGMRTRLTQGISATVSLLLPATVAYALIARPAMRVLLSHRGVSLQSADFVGRLLQIFALSLVPFSLWLLFLRCFYALQDARTPVLVNAWETGTLIMLSVILYAALKVEGLAWADTIAYAVGMVISAGAISQRLGGLDWPSMLKAAARVAGASAVMGVVMFGLLRSLEHRFGGLGGQAIAVSAALLVGGAVFFAAAVMLDVGTVTHLRRALRSRR
jgi:putative peptidoglycan lipid II flippase